MEIRSSANVRWASNGVVLIFCLVVVQTDASVAVSTLNFDAVKGPTDGQSGLPSHVRQLPELIKHNNELMAEIHEVKSEQCQEKLSRKLKERKFCCRGMNMCWSKMKAGMARRLAMRKKSQARLKKVMKQRKLAREKQAGQLKSRQRVFKAMKAELDGYKALAAAAAKKGGGLVQKGGGLARKLPGLEDGYRNRQGSLFGRAADITRAARSPQDQPGQDQDYNPGELAESKKGSVAEDPEDSLEKAKKLISKAKANYLAAKKKEGEADKAAGEAQKAQDAAEKKAKENDEKAQKKDTALDQKLTGPPPKFSFSSRKSKEVPDSDDLPMTRDARGCETQITVGTQPSKRNPDGKTKNLHTCTSCKKGHGLMIQYHRSMAGKCQKYKRRVRDICTELDQDSYAADLLDKKMKNVVCTKVVLVKQPLNLWQFGNKTEEEKARVKFFEPVSKGKLEGVAFAHCQVWKHVVCERGDCNDKKEIRCERVCAADGWKNGQESNCSEDLCNWDNVPICKQTSLLA